MRLGKRERATIKVKVAERMAQRARAQRVPERSSKGYRLCCNVTMPVGKPVRSVSSAALWDYRTHLHFLRSGRK